VKRSMKIRLLGVVGILFCLPRVLDHGHAVKGNLRS
jgi:hypothetical protein